MKYEIKVMPRDLILDTQGRVVENFLKSKHILIEKCTVGKLIEIHLNNNGDSSKDHRLYIEKMMNEGLYNPLIEKYEIING